MRNALTAMMFMALLSVASAAAVAQAPDPVPIPPAAYAPVLPPPAVAANPANKLKLELSNGGTVVIQLRPDAAPAHVERIQTLVRRGFYNGVAFHRVIPGFMAQGGDPTGTGQGDSELPDLKAEFTTIPYMRGIVAAARTDDPNSANSQFFIMFSPNVGLWGKYTVFGRVIAGMDAVDRIVVGEPPANPTRIVRATLGDMVAAPAAAPLPAAPTSGRAGPRGGTADGQVMRVDLFDFELPAERIALRPARPRDSARLLLVDGSTISDHQFLDLPALLRRGDVLVFNDTKVIPAQLEGRRGEARIGATLHKRDGPRSWWSFVRNARRLHVGDRIEFAAGVAASAVEQGADGAFLLQFHGDEPVEELVQRAGVVPLPPYIASRRPADEHDHDDYQTMFAREEGAVAAPTAALHFTPRLLEALDERGIGRETLTLHVGAGTFLPVKTDTVAEHRMHSEWGRIDGGTAQRLNRARAAGGRLIAVGTTSLRLIESATAEDGEIRAFEGDTAIFITPGYRFRSVDGLITNFHLPRSTLFMLVSALMGLDVMKSAYAHAIERGYRFYSYGDASLLLP